MTPAATRSGLAATVLMCAVVASGCGVGPGESAEGTASLTVTRDYGAEVLTTATLEDPTPSDTVVRFLDANADIDTEFGGNFVSTIDGLEGSTVDGGPEDWFFFVNGIYSELGAGEVKVETGDEVWWDYRRWSEAYRVPAVVGSFPEPFLHGYEDGEEPVVVQCLAEPSQCEPVVSVLEDAGVDPEVENVTKPLQRLDVMRVLVGPWEELRADPAAAMIEDGPGTSGVYADIDECVPGDWELEILGADAVVRRVVPSGGFVAAVRRADDAPTFLVAATDDEPEAIEAAVSLFDPEVLRDRYAVAANIEPEEELPVPLPDDLPDSDIGCE